MAKDLQQLFGSGASFKDFRLEIGYYDLLEILEVGQLEAATNPTPEGLAVLLLLALNKTTRLDVDDDGFIIPDNTQTVVSPNSEPRKSFVTREDLKRILTRLSFDIYTEDLTQFEPGLTLDNDNPLYENPTEF